MPFLTPYLEEICLQLHEQVICRGPAIYAQTVRIFKAHVSCHGIHHLLCLHTSSVQRSWNPSRDWSVAPHSLVIMQSSGSHEGRVLHECTGLCAAGLSEHVTPPLMAANQCWHMQSNTSRKMRRPWNRDLTVPDTGTTVRLTWAEDLGAAHTFSCEDSSELAGLQQGIANAPAPRAEQSRAEQRGRFVLPKPVMDGRCTIKAPRKSGDKPCRQMLPSL